MKNVPITIVSFWDTEHDKLELWTAYMMWVLIDQNIYTFYFLPTWSGDILSFLAAVTFTYVKVINF